MTGLRYALSGAFVIALATGLVQMIRTETRRVAGGDSGASVVSSVRPSIWFGFAAVLFCAIVVLTLLFPPGD